MMGEEVDYREFAGGLRDFPTFMVIPVCEAALKWLFNGMVLLLIVVVSPVAGAVRHYDVSV